MYMLLYSPSIQPVSAQGLPEAEAAVVHRATVSGYLLVQSPLEPTYTLSICGLSAHPVQNHPLSLVLIQLPAASSTVCTGRGSEWAFPAHSFHATRDYLIFEHIKPFPPLPGPLFSRHPKCSRAFSCSLCANHSAPLTLLAAFL